MPSNPPHSSWNSSPALIYSYFACNFERTTGVSCLASPPFHFLLSKQLGGGGSVCLVSRSSCVLGELKIGSGPPATPSSPLRPGSRSLRTALPLSVFPPSPFFQHAEELRGRFFFKKTLRWKTYIFLSTPLLRRRGAWGRRKRGKVLLSQELLLEEKGGAPPSSSSSEHFLFFVCRSEIGWFCFSFSPSCNFVARGRGPPLASPFPCLSLSSPFPLAPLRNAEDKKKGAKKGRRRRNGSVFLALPFSPEQKSEGGGDQEWRKAPKPANQP